MLKKGRLAQPLPQTGGCFLPGYTATPCISISAIAVSDYLDTYEN